MPLRPADPASLHPISGRAALARAVPLLTRRPLLVASDFDGTLANLDPDPWGARILPAAQAALRRLAAIPSVHVALISGRTAADLAGRARIGGAAYLGNHGAERGELPRRGRPASLSVIHHPIPEPYRQLAARLAEAVPRAVPEAWLIVERKGPAVAFHFRSAPDTQAAAARVHAAVDLLDPECQLVRFPGRRVLELRPPGAPGKGEAMAFLLDDLRPGAALMLGDDRHDARAFETLRTARAAGTCEGLAIAVAAHPDSLPDVAPWADLLLASPTEAGRFLAGLARHLRAGWGG